MPPSHKQLNQDKPKPKTCLVEPITGEKPAPAAYNWNATGFVSLPAKYQAHCGTCFIFASVAAAESAYYRFKGTPNSTVKFSEQAILNCLFEGKKDTYEDPCFYQEENQTTAGGWPGDAFDYMVKDGLVLQADEPYLAETGHCKKYDVAAKPLDYCYWTKLNDERLQRQLFRNGPLTIAMDSTNLNGVCPGQPFTGDNCSKVVDHAVLLVAYDEQFWYFKNSWGDEWGDSGFFKMSRDSKVCEKCSIYDYIWAPLFELK